MSMMPVKNLEQVQATLDQAGYDYQLELENGKILIVGPSDIDSSEIGAIFSRLLANCVYPRRLGTTSHDGTSSNTIRRFSSL